MQNVINALKQIKNFNILTQAKGNGRFDIARIQENEVITKLNEVLPCTYIAISLTQFLRYNKITYSKKLDSCYGDIVITDINNNPICFIDLKSPMTNKYYGAIKYMSLKNMATEYDGGVKRSCNCNMIGRVVKSDLVLNKERLFHTIIKYQIWVELDSETRYNKYMVVQRDISVGETTE